MRISFTTFACPDWSFEEIVDAADHHGYHGVEFRCDAQHRHGVEVHSTSRQRQRFRARLESLGIEPCCLGTSLKFISERAIIEAPPRIELAAELGCPALRVFCGNPLDSLPHQTIIDQCARQLREAADMASAADIQLWLETHDAMSRAVDCAQVVRTVNHPMVGINYDNMHPFRMGETLETTYAALGNLVRHTHLHDAVAARDRVVVTRLDEGNMPMDDTIRALSKMGFTGYLSGEWFDDMYAIDPDEALAAYHHDMTTLAQRNGIELQ